MGCCCSRDNSPRYQEPPAFVMKDTDVYLAPGEQEVEDAVLEERIMQMIESEGNEADHLVNYAVFLHTKKKAGRAEVEQQLQRAQEADRTHVRTYLVWASFLEEKGDKSAAAEKYREGYEAVYPGGTKVLKEDDIRFIVKYAIFLENAGETTKAGELYKDAALQSPDNALVQGNYGLFLARQGDVAAADARLQTASQLGGEFWQDAYDRFKDN